MTISDEASLAEMIRELSWHYSYCRGLSILAYRKRVASPVIPSLRPIVSHDLATFMHEQYHLRNAGINVFQFGFASID